MYLDLSFLKTEEISLRRFVLSRDDPARKWDPAYHFVICDSAGREIGSCNLRLGHSRALCYAGNIGYKIEEPHRGHHYAAKACKLLFKLAWRCGMEYVIITCNPDNWASRKTCEYLGGDLVDIVELPMDNEMRLKDGETEKCVFKFELKRA